LIAVLDASAAVRTAMDPAATFRAALDAADLVIAPELIVAEVCSAYQKYVRARVLSWTEAEESIEQALALVDKMQPLRELAAEVLALASRVDSSVYDLFYLALAQRTGATLLTADLALRRAARGMGIDAGAAPEGSI
jgi:predicted nucleic acid-binding protein